MTTKFSIKDAVYILHENKVTYVEVRQIRITKDVTTYELITLLNNKQQVTVDRAEQYVFATKEELVASL